MRVCVCVCVCVCVRVHTCVCVCVRVCVCVCTRKHVYVVKERGLYACTYMLGLKAPLPESDYLHDVNTTGWMGRGCNDGEEEVSAFVGKRHVPLNGIMMLCARTHSRLDF